MSDPKVAEAFAEGRIPLEDGLTEEFLNESKDQPAIIAIIFVAALTALFVISRVISRILIVKRVGIDDGLAMASLVCSGFV